MSKVKDEFNNEIEVQDEVLTPEEKRDELLGNERDILAAFKKKDGDKDKHPIIVRIEVRAPGEENPRYAFRIRPLTEKEYNRCREKWTKYKSNKRFGGIKLPLETDTVMYHSELIHTATIPEDRERLWDNKMFWQAFDALTGVDIIEHLIPWAGVKQRIVDKIEDMSGYNDDDDDDDLKN